MSNRIIRTALLAVTLGLPAVAVAGPDRPTTTQTVTASHRPVAAPANQASTYAEREAVEQQAANFEGGMIESSGGAAVFVTGAVIVATMFVVVALLAI